MISQAKGYSQHEVRISLMSIPNRFQLVLFLSTWLVARRVIIQFPFPNNYPYRSVRSCCRRAAASLLASFPVVAAAVVND